MAEPDRPATGAAPHLTAEQARGGSIILRTRAERLIFIAGLGGAILLGLVLLFVR